MRWVFFSSASAVVLQLRHMPFSDNYLKYYKNIIIVVVVNNNYCLGVVKLWTDCQVCLLQQVGRGNKSILKVQFLWTALWSFDLVANMSCHVNLLKNELSFCAKHALNVWNICFTVLLTQNNRGQGNLMVSSCLIVLSFTGHENLSLYGTVKFYGIFIRCWEKNAYHLCLNIAESLWHICTTCWCQAFLKWQPLGNRAIVFHQ